MNQWLIDREDEVYLFFNTCNERGLVELSGKVIEVICFSLSFAF
jgi:hypothetical protein